MGAEKADKEKTKLEKKRLKAQYKAEKARAKAGQVTEMPDKDQVMPLQETPPWYKDPNWIRAIVAIVALMVMVVTLMVTVIL